MFIELLATLFLTSSPVEFKTSSGNISCQYTSDFINCASQYEQGFWCSSEMCEYDGAGEYTLNRNAPVKEGMVTVNQHVVCQVTSDNVICAWRGRPERGMFAENGREVVAY